ncbi:MAG: 2Fe-2S iron-sulfur cluster-binding protein [Deferribacterales bacterium]
MAEIIINKQSYSFTEGESILDVATRNGIKIPTLCYLKDITPTGACRLCLVEVDGADRLQAACVTYAKDGMTIDTENEKVWENRKRMLDFILIKHPLDCPVCDKAGECELQNTAYEFGMMDEIVVSDKPKDPVVKWNKIVYNQNLCVLCEKCMKSCHEMTGCSALTMEDRGFFNHVVPSKGDTLQCDFCGTCIDRCPVGALLDAQFHHAARVWDLENVVTSSVFSPCGEQVEYGVKDGGILRATAVGNGQISAQDRFAFKYLDSADRALNPMVNGNETNWDEATAYLKGKIAGLRGDEVALVTSATLTNEAYAAYKRLMQSIGSKNYVSCTDFRMGDFYDKYAAKFDTMENIGTLNDVCDSDMIFVIGADFRREAVGVKHKVMNAVIHNDAKVFVAGVRSYEYETFITKSYMADYGDFATALEEMKKDAPAPKASDNPNVIEVSNDALKYIPAQLKDAKKVSVIIGAEYLQSGTPAEAVLSFCDFIGQEKLKSVIVLNDQVNYMGTILSGFVRNGYTAQKLMEDLNGGKIKLLINAGFNAPTTCEPAIAMQEAFKKAGTYIAVDLFKKPATVMLGVKDSLETVGTFTTLDGRLVPVNRVAAAKGTQKTHVQTAAYLGEIMGAPVCECAYETFKKDVAPVYGAQDMDMSEVDGRIAKVKTNKFDKTEYTYKKADEKVCTLALNPRYHTNIITAKSYLPATEEHREYHFPMVSEELAGEGTGKEATAGIAKGVILTTKKF